MNFKYKYYKQQTKIIILMILFLSIYELSSKEPVKAEKLDFTVAVHTSPLSFFYKDYFGGLEFMLNDYFLLGSEFNYRLGSDSTQNLGIEYDYQNFESGLALRFVPWKIKNGINWLISSGVSYQNHTSVVKSYETNTEFIAPNILIGFFGHGKPGFFTLIAIGAEYRIKIAENHKVARTGEPLTFDKTSVLFTFSGGVGWAF